MLQNATPLRKSAPGPHGISDKHVSCTAPATENSSWQILKCPTPAIVFGNATQPSHVLRTFDKVHNPVRLPRKTTSERPKVLRTPQFFSTFDSEMCFAPQLRALFSTSQLPKVVRSWGVLYILNSKCASRHNGVHFFDISTSKSVPKLVCFVHFDFDMCFAPQRRATFHLSSGQMAPHPPL